MSDNKKHPPLGDIPETTAFELIASGFGATPVFGPLIQTVLNKLIPNVRAERVEAYIRYLQDQIDGLKLKLALEKPEGLDLFEEGLWQSARAISDERKRYIAELVIKGLQVTDLERQEARHFMRLLEQVDDRQIVLLAKYHPQNNPTIGNDEGINFHSVNQDVLQPGHQVDDFLNPSGQQEAQRGTRLNKLMEGHLCSLGLLDEDFTRQPISSPSRERHFLISRSGQDFLKYIGAIPTGEENG